ncbi:hypothetical protein [Mangrovimonas sp. TPBH4]|uniref:hypothetical protein n=1 Tax=Mangrovimonas sp. TPBH4 TaxID=1645914 RepID=UPI0006B56490|nr:hypothetical protein [Mangrovimonas sp. TPBH4]
MPLQKHRFKNLGSILLTFILFTLVVSQSPSPTVEIIKEYEGDSKFIKKYDKSFKSMGYENYSYLTIIQVDESDKITVKAQDSTLYSGTPQMSYLGFSYSLYLNRDKSYELFINGEQINIDSQQLKKFRILELSLSTDSYFKMKKKILSNKKYTLTYTNLGRSYR